MKFRSMTLQGFKSFPEKTTIEFHDGITSIVGPNGSGKSNITDAIRWVLGEQSAKTLRGSRMEDVIFSGTASRRALGFAEVTLVMDNSDGALDTPYEEVEVRRRLYRSGESEYALNKSRCRLKDIVELFMDSGIGRDGYSLVGQGRIDEVLSPRSEDRRMIFDEAAGISKFRSRKEEADGKLLRTEQNLQRVQDIQREMELHLKPLEAQARKAEQSLRLKKRFECLDRARLFEEIALTKKGVKESTERYNTAARDFAEKQSEREAFVARNEEAKSRLQNLAAERDRARENKEFLQREILRLEQEIQFGDSELLRAERHLRETADDLLREDARLEELRARLTAVTETTASGEALAEVRKALETTEKALAAAEADFRGAQIEEETLREEQRHLEQEQLQLESRRNEKKRALSLMGEMDTALAAYREEASARRRKVRSEIEEKTATLRLLEEEGRAEAALFSKRQDQLRDLEALAEAREERRRGHLAELRDLEYRLRSLIALAERNEGYQQSVKSLLQDLEKGKIAVKKEAVPGPLANLIQVEERYEKAVDTALGTHLQNIVTRDEKTAETLILYLREHRLGRATFLPTSELQSRPPEEQWLRRAAAEPGFLGLASDLVCCEDEIRPCVQYRLGRVFVAEDLPSARSLSRALERRFQVVTTEGDSIAPGGAMSGGYKSKNSQGLGLLERQRERLALEKRLRELHEELEKLREQDEAEREERLRCEEQFRLSEEKCAELHRAELALRAEISAGEKQMEAEENQEESAAREEIRQREKEEEEAALRLTEEFLQQGERKIREIRGKLETYLARTKAARETLDTLREERTAKQVAFSLKEDELRRRREEKEKTRLEYETSERILFRKKEQQEQERREADELKARLTLKRKLLSEQKEKADEACARWEKAEACCREAEAGNQHFLRDLSALLREQEGLQAEVLRLEHRLKQLENEELEKLNALWEGYQLTYFDRDSVPIPENFELQAAKKELRDLKLQLAEIGPVNEHAVEEFAELQTRCSFIRQQHDDILAARVDLERLIHSLSEEMRAQFSESFRFINEQFNEVFRELFAGGQAELILQGEDLLTAEIQIRVCPPGKRMQNMLLLSGGERCLAAIALLFAIQRLKPSAFCVLDEVEAALDEANIFRFVSYLQNYAKKTQFIIVTHRKGTMEAADRIYGVSMPEKGISKVLSLNLEEAGAKVSGADGASSV